MTQSSFRSEGLSILRPLPPETEGKEIRKYKITKRDMTLMYQELLSALFPLRQSHVDLMTFQKLSARPRKN